jgi:hypothetical protein
MFRDAIRADLFAISLTRQLKCSSLILSFVLRYQFANLNSHFVPPTLSYRATNAKPTLGIKYLEVFIDI